MAARDCDGRFGLPRNAFGEDCLMLVQSIPYPALLDGFSGASVARNTSQTVSASDPISWPIEQYDTDNYFSSSSNTILTIPSDGIYALGAQCFALDGSFVRITRNDANFLGNGFAGATGVAPSHQATCAAQFFSAGDQFKLINANASASMSVAHLTTADVNWFRIERLPATVKYALVRKDANQSFSAGVIASATWQTEIADVGDWFDASSNNTRFTVPAGVTLVRLRAGMVTSETGNGPSILGMRKNGASAPGLPRYDTRAASKWGSAISAPIEVEAGDWFDYRTITTAAANLNNSTGTWFQIEEVEDVKERVLVNRSSAVTISVNNTAAIQWNNEAYKTKTSMHSNSVNPSRLIVPDGCTKARLIVNTRNLQGTVGNHEVFSFLNGASHPGRIFSRTGARAVNAASDWIDVIPGDYFTIEVTATTSAFETDINFTWACLECR